MNTKIIACLIVFSVVAACAGSAEITHSWKADTPAFPQSQKILVLTLDSDGNRDLQGYLEKHFTDELCSRNYEAFSSAAFFGSGIFENLTEQEVLGKLKDSGIDAILITTLLHKETEAFYLPAQAITDPVGYYEKHFLDKQNMLSDMIDGPGTYKTVTHYFLETNFYRVHDRKLLYTAQAESYETFTNQALAHAYCRAVIKNMIRQKVLTDGYAVF